MNPTYFTLRFRKLPSTTSSFFYMVEKNICYMSRNTKLADHGNAAWLKDSETAQQVREAVLPTMRKRHGEQVELNIEPCQLMNLWPGSKEEQRVLARIAADTAHILERVRTRNFAPNKAPKTNNLNP